MRRHFFQAVELGHSVRAPSLNPEYGLIDSQVAGQIGVTPKHVATRAMHQEKRRMGPFGLDRHEAGVGRERLFCPDSRRQLGNRRGLEDGDYGQFFVDEFFRFGE